MHDVDEQGSKMGDNPKGGYPKKNAGRTHKTIAEKDVN